MTCGLQCDEPTSRTILDTATAGGITFIDTADVNPLGGDLESVGRTEATIGASRPEQLADSLKAAETPMPADLKQRLNELTVSYRMGNATR